MMKKLWSAVLVLCMILAVMTVSAFAAEDVPQLVDGYYEIYTADQLYWFAAQVNSGNTRINGKLMADIVVNENVLKADGTLNGDGSNFRVWTPIGNDTNRYAGTFDGNGKTVSGLYFKDAEKIYVGLFGYVHSGCVQNVGVEDSYLSGGGCVGGVVGLNYGTVSDCYNTGSVSGNEAVGGVVGLNYGTVSDCYNTGSVSGTYYVGGVVGENTGTVSNCYNDGSVSGTNGVGGVVGYNEGTVSNSYNTGSVSGSGNEVGGVVGYNGGTVSNSYNTGSVIGNGIYVGGVVGYNYYGTVSNCYNTGSVSGNKYVGGVVGDNSDTVSDCYNIGSVSGSGNKVGGVVGYNGGTVSNSYNTGSVSGNEDVGGVVGYNSSNGTVSNCYNIGSVSGSGNKVGGVVGCNTDTVSDCYNTGDVSGSANYVGGVVGDNNGTVSNCYNAGTISGDDYYVGGVVGYNSSNSTVSNCYNTGSVSGSGNDVGGVVGYNDNGTVSDCYNTGSVSGSGREVGGLVGYNSSNSTVSNCYNTGSVSGNKYVGGVVGYNYGTGTVSDCYYLEGCVSSNNSYGTAKTAQQFSSGEVAYLLQGDQTEQVWGQLIGAEPYPVLSKDKVYGGNGHYYNDCDHYWDGGSCTEGVNCFICGAVSSYFPGHQWQDATCDQPKICSVCGTTEGEAQGHSYEGVVTEPDCTHAGFTTYTCTGCGDSYYEDFVAPLGHETYSYSFANGVHSLTCSLCGVTENLTSTDGKQFKFNTASPALAVDIVMNIAVTLPAGFTNPYMVVEFNGTTTTLNDYTIDRSNGRCVFAFPGINPQVMGDTFVATLYADVDGVQVTVELEYSMLKYINSQLKKSTISDALRTALSDLVMYGEANQVYEGYKTDALLSSLLEDAAKENLTPSTFVNLDAGYNQMAITGTAHSSIDLKGVSMALGSKIMVRMTVYCADPSAYTVKVTINGEDHLYPVSKLPLAAGYTDRYVLEFDQIRATQFGEVITFSFLDADGNQLGRTLTYSVYTYVQKNQGSANANLANLLKAIYNYGESVKNI